MTTINTYNTENRSGSPMSVYAELDEINIYPSKHWQRKNVEEDVPMLLTHEYLHIAIYKQEGQKTCTALDKITVEMGLTLQDKRLPTEAEFSKADVALMHFDQEADEVFFKDAKPLVVDAGECGEDFVRFKGECISIEKYNKLLREKKTMKNGTPIKGKPGWVSFGNGQLKEFEYAKWLLEQKKLAKDKAKKLKDVEREAKRQQKEHEEFIAKIKKKIKEHDIFIAELKNIDKLTKEEVLAVVERTERINIMMLKGKSLIDIAISENMSKIALTDFLLRYYSARSPTAYKNALLARHREVSMPWGGKKQRDVRNYIRVPFESYKARLEARADPIVSTEDKSYGSRWYPKAERGQRFSKNILIVPDRTLQPIKRTRIAAHSFLTAGEWHGKKEGKLLTASCRLATTDEDKYLTVEGGLIISRIFALKQELRIGDKILGIYGLKGIVSEIRKQSYDIMLNKNQVWGAKMSRLCAGAVFDVLDNKIRVFYQPEHKIQTEIVEGTEPKVRFSPDLVPFLAYYLTKKEIEILQGDNKKKFQDILYMLNLNFVNKNGYLTLATKDTQPELREGGGLYPFEQVYWGKDIREKGLEKEQVEMGKAGLKYPFILHNIWIPDWFVEENKFTEKDGKVRDAKFIESIKEHPEDVFLGKHCAKFIYKYMFATVEDSISYLTAIAKNGEPNEILLNEIDCQRKEIKEGDYVLLFRYPVVDKLNIQKMKVKFGDVSRTTVGINVESIVLMHGDFDGDPLYLLKIPQISNFAKKFEVNFATYNKARKEITEDIAENDAVKLPKDEREAKILLREAFFRSKIDEGDWLEKKVISRGKKLREEPTGHLRTDDELIEEARKIHESLNISGGKAETIGTLTKWMWLAGDKLTEEEISCVASLEVIKDRVDIESEVKYRQSLRKLNKVKDNLKLVERTGGKKVISWQTRSFEKVLATGTFKKDADKRGFPNLSRLKNKPLVKAGTAYAKFILCLCKVEP